MRLPLSAAVVLLGYVVAITAFGTWLGRRRRSVRDYFLGGRSVPWWAIASCIVATETSTLTFIGAPGTAYKSDWTFLQLVFGYILGRIVIAAVFLPAYFRGEIYTSYELLQKRFGGAVRGTSAAIFLLYRTLGDGIRLHAAALVLAVASGGPRWEGVWIIVLAQFTLFLFLGTLFWAHYHGRPFTRGDEVLPTFVSTELPGGWTGFILAAIVAAALSPSLNSMASATLRDFYLPYFRPAAGEAEQMRVGRIFTVFWGVAQMAVAFLAQGVDSALQAGLAALGYASGPTVGAFLLGVLTRTASSVGTMAGMVAGLGVSLCAGQLAPYLFGVPGIAWTWNVAVGATVTFAVGLSVSRLIPRQETKAASGPAF